MLIYFKYKNLEVQNSKKSLINKHITGIDTELNRNTMWLQKAFTLASQVIQNGSLNAPQSFHYDQLTRFLTNGNRQNELDVVENSFNGIHPTSSDEDGELLQTDDKSKEQQRLCTKRLRLDEYELDDLEDINGSTSTDDDGDEPKEDIHATTFKIPTKRPRNLNETHVLSEVGANANATFHTDPSPSSTLTAKTKNNVKGGKVLSSNRSNMVSNLISEQMVKTPANADQLKNGKYLNCDNIV